MPKAYVGDYHGCFNVVVHKLDVSRVLPPVIFSRVSGVWQILHVPSYRLNITTITWDLFH
jgi:hypothetical protein